MNTRDRSLLIGFVLLLAAAAGVLVLGGSPGPVLPEEGGPGGGAPGGVEAPEAPGPGQPVTAEFRPSEAGSPAGAGAADVDTSGWTDGRLEGSIRLDPRIYSDIRSITATLEEARTGGGSTDETRPFRVSKGVSLGRGTPGFTFTGIPFSRHGYFVSVHSPGLNGSSQFVQIDEEQPYAEVTLDIASPVVYSVLLRDQDHNPVTDTRVFLVPEGRPRGRARHEGVTDNFGSLQFEDVLAGPYRILVGSLHEPHVDPVEVEVQMPGLNFAADDRLPHTQGTVVEVPRGSELTVEVLNNGYGIAGASVRIYRTDSQLFQEWKGETDEAGRYRPPPLVPGHYHIEVDHERYDRRSKEVRVRDGDPPRKIEMAVRAK